MALLAALSKDRTIRRAQRLVEKAKIMADQGIATVPERPWSELTKAEKPTARRSRGNGFELVWGFPCQVVFFGLLPVLCSERGGAFFVPSPAIRFPERAEGVKGSKR